MTTNFEISKKLKEIGFEAETDIYWYCYDNGQAMRHVADADGKGNVKSYDLGTILDALPLVIERAVSGNDIYFKMNKNRVWYENSCNCDSNEYCRGNIYYRIDRQKKRIPRRHSRQNAY